MQKFPLRMKDNDLLVTELYKDPSTDPITAISVYLTPKTSKFMTVFFPSFYRINFVLKTRSLLFSTSKSVICL